MEIEIPHNFLPRDYQLPILKAIEGGVRRAICVWHRRSGKDKTFLNLMVREMFQRVGAYYYYFPTATQGRRILWDGRDRAGFKFTDHIPKEIRKNTNNVEMKIELVNGSIFQILGTDRSEVVGPNPVGCVFSEFALQNPQVWDYVRPILVENEGWAIFNFTPRGMNHAYDLWVRALDNKKWYTSLLTVTDTGAISQEDIQEEIDAGMRPELVEQEFFCSFEYGLEGAYFLKELNLARKEGRVRSLPIDDIPVYTFWDLGMDDSTSIWFAQFWHQEIRLIDYYEASGEGLQHYARMLKDKGYLYAEHWGPHDIEVRELGTGLSRIERAKELGIDFRVVPRTDDILDDIEQTRRIMVRCYWDEDRTRQGLACLQSYRKEYDEKRKIFTDRPGHDWAAHGADAFRTLAVATGSNPGAFGTLNPVKPYRRKRPPSWKAA